MEEIELKDLIMMFWKRKILIIVVLILFAILGVVYTKCCVVPQYAASSSFILVRTEFETEADVNAYVRLAERYRVVAESRNVLNKVITNLKLDCTISELRKKVTVSASSYCITIKAIDEDSMLAVEIANEMAKIVVEEISIIYNDKDVQMLDYAIEDLNQINVDLTKNILIFVAVGGILVFGYILLINFSKNEKNVFDKK